MYDLLEAEMVLSAYNRCGKQFTSDNVIRKFWSLFFNYNGKLKRNNDFHMSSFLRQMYRYTSHLNSVEQLEAIGNHGCCQTGVEELVTVIKCLTTVRFHHTLFVHHIIKQIEELARNNVNIRVKSVAVLCEFVADYGLEESETCICCFDNLSKLFELSSGEAAMSAEHYPKLNISDDVRRQSNHMTIEKPDIFNMRFAIGMAIAGRFPLGLISHLLKEGANKTSLFSHQLLLLQACIDIECPYYSGNHLCLANLKSDERANEDVRRFLSQKNHLSKLVLTVVNNIVGEKFFKYHRLLPYGNEVIEIRLDEEKRPTEFDPVPYYKLPSTVKHANMGIIILVHNRRQTTFNGGIPLGRLKLQSRHLRKLGYKVVEVPVLSPKELQSDRSEQNMTEMLRKKLIQDYNVVLREAGTLT
ncbi:uncharacterized protein LOC117321600 isoform X2 [Pecten maximus]|nr:uncharacterized protein LOC117321600 isoform X2 [Pecten maximus]